jgi:hypothetical protein
MRKYRIYSLLLFLVCSFIPYFIINLFPASCGYGICVLFYYVEIFLVSLVSAVTYYKFNRKFNRKFKINNTLQLLMISLIAGCFLIYLYPKGEYYPSTQISKAKHVYNNYENLKPSDLFSAIEHRDFILITALYHKYELPKETYSISYCLKNENGGCDTIIKEFNYYFLKDSLVTDRPDLTYKLDSSKECFTIIDTIAQVGFELKLGYPQLGKFKSSLDGASYNLSDNGSELTAITKEFEHHRILIDKKTPKFEYQFTQLFERYLKLKK